MIKKNKLIFILIMVITTLILFGCTELDKSAFSEFVEDEILTEKNNLKETLDSNGNLKAHFIDVGQGSSVFIVGPDGKTMLYDAGGDDQGSGRIITDYIKSIGYDHIDVAVFTHPHADHINGATTVLKEIKVDSIYYPKVTHTTKTFEKFVDAVHNAGLKFKTAKAGVEIPFGETSAILVAPMSSQYEDLNDYSAVLKLTWNNRSILLTGDIEDTSENEIINSKQDVDVDVLLVSHHGSNSSTSNEFLDQATPSYAVISCGLDNSYGHPHKEVIDRLKERNIRIYNTAKDGTVVATFNEEEISFKTTEIEK